MKADGTHMYRNDFEKHMHFARVVAKAFRCTRTQNLFNKKYNVLVMGMLETYLFLERKDEKASSKR